MDRGGTFTDCIGRCHQTGEWRVIKVLSGDDAPVRGVRALLGLQASETPPPCDIRMGTTVATNALLERRGAATLLVTNEGFEDLWHIGDQSRPELFDLDIEAHRATRLYSKVVSVPCRDSVCGQRLGELPLVRLRALFSDAHQQGYESIAVALIHATRYPELENLVGALAREVGFEFVTLSHEVSSEAGLLARGDTALVEAYLEPVVSRYIAGLSEELPGSRILLMQSNGGLVNHKHFRACDGVLSGPAGGVVAATALARSYLGGGAIGLDMGGTSADVCRVGEEPRHVYETRVGGSRIRTPMLALHTVAAGGGSICEYLHGRFRVGPESAGAKPGPLAYGDPAASALTLTDVALFLGRISPASFPLPLETDRVEEALERVRQSLADDGRKLSRPEIAESFRRVATESMVGAIRRVSVEEGYDPREGGLIIFGGAAGQYACGIAESLGIDEILVHPWAGVFSAFGMGQAPLTWHADQDISGQPKPSDWLRAAGELEDQLRREAAEFAGEGDFRVEVRIDVRYRGTEVPLSLPLFPVDTLSARFSSEHARRFGYQRPEATIEASTLRVRLQQPVDLSTPASGYTPAELREEALPSGKLWCSGRWMTVDVMRRAELRGRPALAGPLLVVDETGTTVVESGFVVHCDAEGVLRITRIKDDVRAAGSPDVSDAIRLEILGYHFMSIAEQMGGTLRRTAMSTNIRERLDFSCAVFTGEGALIANAPHIPVHLGSMGAAVRSVLRSHPQSRPGDVFITNDPQNGGTHLPDITVITPVHDPKGRVWAVVASRGHHADVGGISPGSMPADSRTLSDEGVVLRNLRLVQAGCLDTEAVLRELKSGTNPARDPEQNLADLRAQVAANHQGLRLLEKLAERYGEGVVEQGMHDLIDASAREVRAALATLPTGAFCFEDRLDDGTPVVVQMKSDAGGIEIQFEGTGAAGEHNLNAPRAITTAAIMYFLRTFVGSNLPLNEGFLVPVDVQLPEGSLLAPPEGSAVVAGNVETSQRIVDVLLGATRLAAASQGTMNNLTFGDAQVAYYETIGGGAGAGPGFDGASGVHTHMTNSRITDPETLETRYPVRLWRFSLRAGSGGGGRHRGGDGLCREFEFLRPMEVSILSERRTVRPFGLEGGEAGASGRNLLDGKPLPGRVRFRAQTGQRLVIESPGGGGFGRPEVDAVGR